MRLNGNIITDPTRILKNGDLLSHTLHRHEPPVSAQPIGIVHEDDDMLVINKPAGIPVHPTGRYNYNSITEILRAEHGYGFKPLPCNRLDRLTSGVMFIAKHQASAADLTAQITLRTVKKEYIARVKGEFPTHEITCNQPILQISPKLGLNRVRPTGREAHTVFQRLAYHPDGREGFSIVRCRPLTGRTHQLRVHLQYLGHPIENDPIYCNRRVFGNHLAKGDEGSDDDESIMQRLARVGKTEEAQTYHDEREAAYHDELAEEYKRKTAEKLSGEVCEVCKTELYNDPSTHELGIYLHALKYADENGKWAYETSLPHWALSQEHTSEPEAAVEVAGSTAT